MIRLNMLKENLHYFNFSKKHPEKFLDKYYIFDKKHKDLKEYISKTKEIKEFLITIKKLEDNKENSRIINKYYLKLQQALNHYSNTSEFIAFVNACDSYLDVVKSDLKLLKEITKRYFKERTLTEIVPEEWIQAIIDSHTSRKKGQAGENKLIDVLKKNGYKLFNKKHSWQDFLKVNKAVAKFSTGKKSDFNMSRIRKNLGAKIKTSKQNKILDLIIKKNKKIFLLEAKHINTSGGEQDKQISELIEVLSLKEKNKNIHYIAFLDGYKSNLLLGKKPKIEGKLKNQQKEINSYLRRNKKSFWVNTGGFIKLIKDLS